MPLIRYEALRFTKDVQNTIDQANAILAEYHAKGYSMTLRQLYYQFVSRALVPENTIRQYKRLGDTMKKARNAGLTDWFALSDNGRFLRGDSGNPDGEYLPFLKGAADGWTIDLWKNQKRRPEVWVEKDALSNIIGRVCDELAVPWFPAKGYNSTSEAWRAGMRLRQHKIDGYEPIIFHLGDHDPSGVDMTGDNENRLWMYAGFAVELHRLALNMDQVREYNPPSMPAKKTDSRTAAYEKEHGKEGWELDALEPEIIDTLIRDAILGIRDQKAWDERVAEQARQRAEIVELVSRLEPPDPSDPYVWRSAF